MSDFYCRSKQYVILSAVFLNTEMKEFKARATFSLYPPLRNRILGSLVLLTFLFADTYLYRVLFVFEDAYVKTHEGHLIEGILSFLLFTAVLIVIMGRAIVSLLFEAEINVKLCNDGFLCTFPVRGVKLRPWSDFRNISIVYRASGDGKHLEFRPIISCKYNEYFEVKSPKLGRFGEGRNNMFISADEKFIQELKRINPDLVSDIRTMPIR